MARSSPPQTLYTGVLVCLEATYKMSADKHMELIVTCLEPSVSRKKAPKMIKVEVPYEFEGQWFKLRRGSCVGVVDLLMKGVDDVCKIGRITQSSVLTHCLLEDEFFAGKRDLASLFVNGSLLEQVTLIEQYLYACARKDYKYARYILAWFTVMDKAKIFEKDKEQFKDVDVPQLGDSGSTSTDPPSSGHDAELDDTANYTCPLGSSSFRLPASPMVSSTSVTVNPEPDPAPTTKQVTFQLPEDTTISPSHKTEFFSAEGADKASKGLSIRKYTRSEELTEAAMELHDYLYPQVRAAVKATLLR